MNGSAAAMVVVAAAVLSLVSCGSTALSVDAASGAGGATGGIGGAPTGSGGATDLGGGGQDGSTVTSNPILGRPLATFDDDLDGFSLSTYHDVSQVNLGDPSSGAAQTAVLSLDATVGSPTPGSLQLTVPFSGANQYIAVQNSLMFTPSQPANWTGGKLRVRIKADGGTFGGVVQPFVDTTASYAFGGSAFIPAAGGDWQEVVVDLDLQMTESPGYDPTQVVLFGLMLSSGSAGASQGPVTFHIDSFSIDLQPSGTPDAN